MTLTGKTRLFLVLASLLPPLILLLVMHLYSRKQSQAALYSRAHEGLTLIRSEQARVEESLKRNALFLAAYPEIKKALWEIERGRIPRLDERLLPPGLDFAEILDDSLTVLVGLGQASLAGEKRNFPITTGLDSSGAFCRTVEFDHIGRHAGLVYLMPLDDNIILLAGKYLETDFVSHLEDLSAAKISLFFGEDRDSLTEYYFRLEPEQIYTINNSLIIRATAENDSPYLISAAFAPSNSGPFNEHWFPSALAVSLTAALLAILAGIYITGKARREIDNLITAANRIADGDYNTPAMAFEDAEFARLADSFTDMTRKIRETTGRLAAAEQVAAWKAIGQKIAHEIKNPLTPMAISVDDLRRSYHDKLPDFDKTLDETTLMIKSEIDHLTRLLDNFVAFARMAPPVIKSKNIQELMGEIKSLYRREFESGRLVMTSSSARQSIDIDAEKVRQLLVNLIKNALESAETAGVKILIEDDEKNLRIIIDDSGPGFEAGIIRQGIRPYLTTKKGGSGLGLVICQRIAFDHGGNMAIDNNPEGGGRVTITLPV